MYTFKWFWFSSHLEITGTVNEIKFHQIITGTNDSPSPNDHWNGQEIIKETSISTKTLGRISVTPHIPNLQGFLITYSKWRTNKGNSKPTRFTECKRTTCLSGGDTTSKESTKNGLKKWAANYKTYNLDLSRAFGKWNTYISRFNSAIHYLEMYNK